LILNLEPMNHIYQRLEGKVDTLLTKIRLWQFDHP
jgi:hypothetical protein